MMADMQIPEAFAPLLTERWRYKFYYGGRGGGKSYAFADSLALLGAQKKIFVACLREIQDSIKDSVYKLLKERIELYQLPGYRFYEDRIDNVKTGSRFIFKGLRDQNSQNIKSLEGVDYCWIEEGQTITRKSWDILNPTIRKDGSEIWISMNREEETDALWVALAANPDERTLVRKVNYYDNPFCPRELKQQAEKCKREDYESYLHVWEGDPLPQGTLKLISSADVHRALAFKIANAARAGTAGALIPGAIDIQGRPLLAPMQYGNNLSITLELQNQVREAIHNVFLQPLFLSLAQTKEMTAEEARLREQEKAMLLAPMGERINSEWMVGNCEREIDIIREYGLLDEVPDELMEDGSLQIEFESPLVHMQQAGEIKGVFETLESAMSLSQADPTVLDRIDMGEALTIIANYKGVPSRILRTPEQIQALGEARAQQQQAEQLLQAAPVLSQSMKNLKGAGA